MPEKKTGQRGLAEQSIKNIRTTRAEHKPTLTVTNRGTKGERGERRNKGKKADEGPNTS